MTRRTPTIAVLLLSLQFIYPEVAVRPKFMPLDSARPVLQQFASPGGMHPKSDISSRDWTGWLQKSDAAVRQRLDAGEEDSLTNLLRFGVTFTKEYRIDDDYLVSFGQSSLVNAFAENRANDLVKALANPNGNQGVAEMRAFVEKKGYGLQTPESRKKLKAYLLANLARMRTEFMQLRAQSGANQSQKFQNRGISLDSNLWPDYDIDLQLREMIAKGMLSPGSVRRVAVVGPGLDFVNKQDGVDFYPPQTVQPFAVLDSLLRLGLSKPGLVQLVTLDISSRVNLHLQAARKNAAAGRPYTIQLPWYADGRWTPEFHTQFAQWWQQLGSQIGQATAPIPVPQSTPGYQTRAVRVRPAIVNAVTPIDMNIVYQRLALTPDQRFDLIVGTNIFIYYGAFEQSLARANISSMLMPGGYVLSNNELENAVPSGLKQVLTTSVPMTPPPAITDHMYCYQKAR